VNGAASDRAGASGDEPNETLASLDGSLAREERVRLLKAAGLGFALGLLMARWGSRSP
jgi:cell division inhibitor SulA